MVDWKESLQKIKKELKLPQIDSVKIKDRGANFLLDEILAKNKNVKLSKIGIDFSIVPPTPVIHQNVTKNKEKLTEVPLFFDRVFHMTHIDNLRNILKNGLLSHNLVKSLCNSYKQVDISNQNVNQNRNKKETI